MSGVPGYPGATLPPAGQSVHAQLNALAVRLGRVEAHTQETLPQVLNDVREIKKATERFAKYEATVKSLLSRYILLVVSSVGATYGVTRATVPGAPATKTEVIKSATTVRIEACTAMQPGPSRDQCALDVLRELMGPDRR